MYYKFHEKQNSVSEKIDLGVFSQKGWTVLIITDILAGNFLVKSPILHTIAFSTRIQGNSDIKPILGNT